MFIIAYVSNKIVYAYHNKVYTTKEKAESSLRNLIKKDSLVYSEYKVFEGRLFDIK